MDDLLKQVEEEGKMSEGTWTESGTTATSWTEQL